MFMTAILVVIPPNLVACLGVWILLASNNRSLDSIDRAILFQLSRDGRLTNVELANRVGLTPPPCLRRVKRLEEEGFIVGYRAQIAPEVLGRRVEVIVAIEVGVQDPATLGQFEKTVASYSEVVEVRRMFGRPDYFVHVAVENPEAYEKFLTTCLIGLPAVTRIDSHLTMKTVKDGD